jgi:hypothetical protein
MKYKSATLVNKFIKLIFRVFVSDELCDIIQWRGYAEGKTVKEIGLSQLHNLLAVIVGKCNMAMQTILKLQQTRKAKICSTSRLVRTSSREVSDFLLCLGFFNSEKIRSIL